MPGPMRDSLSRCDSNPYSMYEVRKRPADQKPDSAKMTQPIKKDTLEIRKDNLKKEALDRLQMSKKIPIFQPGFVRIGKYVFLGIALPPYLLLYGIPKWVIIVALPNLYNICSTYTLKGWAQLVKKIERMVNFIQLLSSHTQKQFQRLIQPIVKLAFNIKQAIQRFSTQINQWVQHGLTIIKKPFEKIKKAKTLGTALKKSVGNKFQLIKEWTLSKTKPFNDFFNTASDFSKKIKENFLKAPKEVARRIQSVKEFLAQQSFSVKWETSQKLASDLFKKAKSYFDPYKARFVSGKEQLKNFFSNIIGKPFSAFYQRCNGKYRSFKRSFDEKKEKFQGFLRKLQGKLKVLKSKTFEATASENRFRWLPAFLRRPLLKFLNLPQVQKCIDLARRVGIATLYYPLKGIELALDGVHFAFSYISKGIKFVFSYVQVGGKFVLDRISDLFALIGRWIRFVLFHFLVGMIMFGILVMWGCQLTKEISTRLLFKRVTTRGAQN